MLVDDKDREWYRRLIERMAARAERACAGDDELVERWLRECVPEIEPELVEALTGHPELRGQEAIRADVRYAMQSNKETK